MLEEKQSLEARIKRLEDQLRAKEAELDASKNQQVLPCLFLPWSENVTDPNPLHSVSRDLMS